MPQPPERCLSRQAGIVRYCLRCGPLWEEAPAKRVGETNTLVTGPCGVCRQALYEFGGPELTVIMARSEDDYIVTTLGDLLPYGFGPANLE